MPHKQVQCSTCSKMMRSDNLKRHKVSCLSKHQQIEIRPAENENAIKVTSERLCDKNTTQIESGVLTILLKWDGKCWKIINRDHIRYQLNLGRDLVSLLRNGAIKEDVLNNKQKDLIKMYNDLLLE